MSFADQPASTQWTALKFRGVKIADVWLKPASDPLAVALRFPREGFRLPGVEQQLTLANLLKAVGIAPAEVESWRQGDVVLPGEDGGNPEFAKPIAPPPPEGSLLEIQVRLKAPASPEPPAVQEAAESAAPDQQTRETPEPQEASPVAVGSAAEAPEDDPLAAQWHSLESRWKAILALEASLDTLRISMEGLYSEMESLLKRALTTEEKLHARRADLAEWTKAKSRVHHAVPRLKESIHRFVWAMGAPERKQLDEVYKDQIQPRLPFPQMDKVLEQLEYLQKDRQILFAHGTTVYHECKSTAASAQGTLRTLQNGAAMNAKKKSGGGKSKFFKSVRHWSGAE